jgi:chemotaxis protein MotB
MQENGSGGDSQPPIIIKKIVAAGGHHGGAWKVAYADFVTAMMALFMVLWLMNANEETQQAVASYFKDPKGVGEKLGSGQAGSGSGLAVGADEMENLAEHIENSMKEMSQFESLKEQVQMTVTAMGLRIELLETEQGMFFESGSPTPSQQGREILAMIVGELNKLPNRVALEGHTDAKPFRGARAYTNWELSVDRANGARRFMVDNGFSAGRIAEVRGFADRQLRDPSKPEDAANRRISLIVMYEEHAGDAESPPAAASGQPATHDGPAAAEPSAATATAATREPPGSPPTSGAPPTSGTTPSPLEKPPAAAH